jgi:hypothetical protein
LRGRDIEEDSFNISISLSGFFFLIGWGKFIFIVDVLWLLGQLPKSP